MGAGGDVGELGGVSLLVQHDENGHHDPDVPGERPDSKVDI